MALQACISLPHHQTDCICSAVSQIPVTHSSISSSVSCCNCQQTVSSPSKSKLNFAQSTLLCCLQAQAELQDCLVHLFLQFDPYISSVLLAQLADHAAIPALFTGGSLLSRKAMVNGLADLVQRQSQSAVEVQSALVQAMLAALTCSCASTRLYTFVTLAPLMHPKHEGNASVLLSALPAAQQKMLQMYMPHHTRG